MLGIAGVIIAQNASSWQEIPQGSLPLLIGTLTHFLILWYVMLTSDDLKKRVK